MKNLVHIKIIVMILLLALMTCLFSCSTPEEPQNNQEQSKTLDITIQGNSPELWYHNAKDNTTTKYTQSHIVLNVYSGDTINAIAYGYTIDNSNNYGASNVVVIGYITFKLNGIVIANGVDTLAYLIK